MTREEIDIFIKILVKANLANSYSKELENFKKELIIKYKLKLEQEQIKRNDIFFSVLFSTTEEDLLAYFEKQCIENNMVWILVTMPEERKITIIKNNTKLSKEDLIILIKSCSDDVKEQLINTEGLDLNSKVSILKSARNNEELKYRLAKKIINSHISDENFATVLTYLDVDNIKKLMQDTIEHGKAWNIYRTRYADCNFIKDNITFFIETETNDKNNIQNMTNTILKMFETNNEIVSKINFKILGKKYLENIGESKINLISCYPDIQEKILSLSDKQLNVFSKCINCYIKQQLTDEWTPLAQELLKHIEEYTNLIDNIDNIETIELSDLEKLIIIMQNENWLKIDSINEVRNYNFIKKEKCKEIIEDNNSTIEQKKQAIMQKLFGNDLSYAKKMIEKYGEDIENVDECEIKDYIRSLKIITETEDERILQMIFDKCEYAQLNKIMAERDLKNQYLKKYIDKLYVPKEEDKKGEFFEAGTEFNILLTSIKPFSGSSSEIIENYETHWNKPIIDTQHFCASYIRNDMIGIPPIPYICYGFSKLKEDALMLSGPTDIFSTQHTFVSEAERREKYYTPDTQINKTEVFNEMDFRRIQNGERKKPDYIVVFRTKKSRKKGKNNIETEEKEIKNEKEARRASEQWGGIPIVVIDIEECLKNERKKVQKLLDEYKQDPTVLLAKKILQKVRNNRQTDFRFCGDIEQEINELRKFVLEQEESNKSKTNTRKTIDEEQISQLVENIAKEEKNEHFKKIYDEIIKLIDGGHDEKGNR